MDKEEYLISDNITYKCNICGNIWSTSESSPQFIRCQHCIHKAISSMEKDIVRYITEKSSYNIIENDRDVLNGKELDIYIPTCKLAIEFNGVYWHSTLFKDKHYHISKTRVCNEHDIRLIHINEYEWINNTSICKSVILSALNVYDRYIDVNNCTICEICDNEFKNFAYENNITKYKTCGMKYGMYYNDELVSIFGLRKLKNKYIIKNYCNKLFTHIDSFRYFVNYFDMYDLVICIDISKESDNNYIDCGFTLQNTLEPIQINVDSYKMYNCGYKILGKKKK